MQAGSDEAGSQVPLDKYFEGFGTQSEGIKARIKSGIYSYRTKTIDSLLELVQEKLACLLIAPPFTGKTALCLLAAARARDSTVYSEVYYINCGCVAAGSNFEQECQRLYEKPFASMCSPPSSNKKRLIVVDEVQNVYESSETDALWWLIKYITSDQDPSSLWQSSSACDRYSQNINVLLTGSRGFSPVMTAFSISHHFGADQRIPVRSGQACPWRCMASANMAGSAFLRRWLWACRPREPGKLVLQFTVDEYEEIFVRFCEQLNFAPAELAPLQAMVAALTQRYPGTVLHVLDILKINVSPANFEVAREHWQGAYCKFLGSERFISSLAAIRSFPR